MSEKKKGGLVVHGVLATTTRCHVGGDVNNMDGCTISVSMREVCEDRDESLARLQMVSAATTLVGVVSLLRGVAEMHRYFPRSYFSLVDVFGRKYRFGVGSA